MRSTENAQLREASVRKDQIILEKVASAAPKVSREAVEQLTDTLISYGLAKRASREETIEQFLSHPDSLVKLAAELAPVSVSSPSQGAGIAKEASASKPLNPDLDDWQTVVEKGA